MVEEKLDDILKDKNHINILYSRANSFSRRKDIIRDLAEIISLEYFFRGYDIDMLPCNIANSSEYYEFEEDCIENSDISFFNNYSFYKKQSEKGINNYFNNKFDQYFSGRNKNNIKLKRNEGIEIVSDFLNEQNPKAYNLFSNMLKNEQIIYMDYFSDIIDGKCYNISKFDKKYIIISGEKNTLKLLSLMMHEFGHAYEFDLLNNKNFEQRNGIYKTFLHETSSFYFEIAFYNYLKKNRIYPVENYFLREEFFGYLLQSFVEEYYITHARVDKKSLIFFEKDMKKIEKLLREKYGYSICFDEEYSIDYNSTLVYLSSILVAFELVCQNSNVDSSFFKEFDNTLMTYGLTHDNLIFKNLGVTKEILLDSKNLKNNLKSHREEGITLKLK